MTTESKAKILSILQNLKVVGEETDFLDRVGQGICYYVKEKLGGNSRIASADVKYWEQSREEAFIAWGEFSGDITFPVGTAQDIGLGPFDQWVRPKDYPRWSGGAYAEARWRLLDYLIEWYSK